MDLDISRANHDYETYPRIQPYDWITEQWNSSEFKPGTCRGEDCKSYFQWPSQFTTKSSKLNVSADRLDTVLSPVITMSVEESAKRTARLFEKSLQSSYFKKTWIKPFKGYIPKLNILIFSDFSDFLESLIGEIQL
jgi:hypothetical protein